MWYSNPIQDGTLRLLTDGWEQRSPLPKSNLSQFIPCLKKIQKCINRLIHPLSSERQRFSPEISDFCYIRKFIPKLNFDTFFLIPLTNQYDYNFDNGSKIDYSRPP